MDGSEKLAEIYLKTVFDDVRYEPDGNVPPDFLADGRVAVEVRCLNQNCYSDSKKKKQGLEEDAIPIRDHVSKYLIGLGPAPASGQSWFVNYSFERPVPAWKDLKRELDRHLKPFMECEAPQRFKVRLDVSGEFKIDVFPCANPQSTFFLLGGYSDGQSGGWVNPEIADNLQHCIDEKSEKIRQHWERHPELREKYSEWWLVLPDLIGFGIDEFDQESLLDQFTIQPSLFDKVVLIDPRDPTRAFIVKK